MTKLKFITFIAIIIFLGINVSSCQNPSGKGMVLTAEEFDAKLSSTADAQLIDVRTPGEYSERHLHNSKNIDWNGNNFEGQVKTLDKSKPVLVYCLSGGRSARAAVKLRDMGFKEVYDMQGGINAWSNANLPLATAGDPEKLMGMSLDEYTKQLKTDKLVLIDFYAPWCIPCKKMAPMLEEISVEQKDKLQFIRINADENSVVVKAMQVENLPSFFLYKNEKMVWSHIGLIEKTDLLKVIAEN
jgi:thioredoxin 1